MHGDRRADPPPTLRLRESLSPLIATDRGVGARDSAGEGAPGARHYPKRPIARAPPPSATLRSRRPWALPPTLTCGEQRPWCVGEWWWERGELGLGGKVRREKRGGCDEG